MAENESVEEVKAPSLVARVLDAISKDGHLAAFGRQGLEELGTALKAFPDSISVDEVGTIWNPTQGEIAADRRPDFLSSSEIAKDRSPYVPEHNQDDDQSRGR